MKANQEARALVLRARAYGDVEDRSPAEALLAASSSLDASLQRLEALAGDDGGAGPILLREIRSAAVESARVSKLVQDAGLDERRQELAERDAAAVVRVIERVLTVHGLAIESQEVRTSVAQAIRELEVGDTRREELRWRN